MNETDSRMIEASRSPIPWEDRQRFPGFWRRFWETLRLGIVSPLEFFRRIPNSEGAFAPIGFALLLSVPGYLFLCLYPAVFGVLGLIGTLAGGMDSREPPFLWLSLGCCGGLLLVPLIQAGVILLLGLGQYLLLRLWAVHASDIGLEHDLRAFAYAHGFVVLAMWTPLGPVAALLVAVVMGMGYARMHRKPTWRGIAATVTPFALLLVGLVTVMVSALVLAAKQEPQAAPPAQRNPPGLVLPPPKSLSPDEEVDRLVMDAAIALNRLAGEGSKPEEAIRIFLDSPEAGLPIARNPYEKGGCAFLEGSPTKPGEIGLAVDSDYRDIHGHPRAAVSILGRTRTRELRRTIQF